MKIKTLVITSLITAFIIIGCCDCIPYTKVLITTNIWKDKNGTLTFWRLEDCLENWSYNYVCEDNESKITEYKMINGEWVKTDEREERLLSSNDSYVDINYSARLEMSGGSVRLLLNGEEVFEDELPSAEEIASEFGIRLDKRYEIHYRPFLTGQYYWDGKKYVVSIGTEYEDRVPSVFYYFYVYKDKYNNWNYRKVKVDNPENTCCVLQFSKYKRYSLDGKVNLCDKNVCFILEDDGDIHLKDLFGDIYPKEYKEFIDSQYNSASFCELFPLYNVSFDEDGNMMAFYNSKGDIREQKYKKYFRYGFFKKESPSKPVYEQKIYLKD